MAPPIFFLSLFLSLAAGQQRAPRSAPYPVAQELLDRAVEVALPAVEKELGVELRDRVSVVLATRDELHSAIEAELREWMQGKEGLDPKLLDEATAGWMSELRPVRHIEREGRILVVPENVTVRFKRPDIPAELVMPALHAAILHELVLAADEIAFSCGERMRLLGSEEEIYVYTAVREGRAQAVARRLAKRLGWQKGFEACVQARTSAAPINMRGDEELIARVNEALTSFKAPMYMVTTLGEEFIGQVERKLRTEGVRRALTSPPSELAQLLVPERFFGPDPLPPRRFDLDRALQPVSRRFPGYEWDVRTSAIESLFMLRTFQLKESAPRIERVRRVLRAGRSFEAAEKDKGKLRISLCEFLSHKDALFALDILADPDNKKVERAREKVPGVQQDALREPVEGILLRGPLPGAGREELILMGTAGELLVSVHSSCGLSRDEVIALARELVEGAR